MSVPSTEPADAARHAAATLHDIVGRALDALQDLHTPGGEIVSGRVESELRATAAEWERQRTAGAPPGLLGELVAAIRIVCAHLGAHDLVEARLALVALRDAVASQRPSAPDDGGASHEGSSPAERRARVVSASQKRALRQQATVEQAIGVVAARGGTSPRNALGLLRAAAARRGVALLELADDVVRGRVDASVILGGRQHGRLE